MGLPLAGHTQVVASALDRRLSSNVHPGDVVGHVLRGRGQRHAAMWARYGRPPLSGSVIAGAGW